MDERNSPLAESASATQRAEQQSGEDAFTSDLPSLDELYRRYRFSSTARAVIDAARDSAEGLTAPVSLTTSSLLFAMVEQGRQRAYGITQFLSTYITEKVGQTAYELMRREYLLRKGNRESVSRPTSKTADQIDTQDTIPLQRVTRNTLTVFQQAWTLAKELGEEEIHTRHLLASLLVNQRDGQLWGAHQRLENMGINQFELREALLAEIESHTGEQHSVWEKFLLGKVGDLRRLSGYTADSAHGRDLIGISRDVNAFATLIAAETVHPPLAIGLFGEWGSGKTFFMNQLRAAVDSLATEMNEAGEMQRDLPFYKRIVQIEFNAWHYVQGELWPSLMEHLLDNLQLAGEQASSASQELRNHLMQELQKESTALEATKRDVKDAREEIDQTEQEVSRAREELKVKEKDLRETSVRVDLQDFDLMEIKDEVNVLLNALGMAPVSAAARDLGNALQEARGVLEHGYAVLTPLVRAEDRRRRWRILLLGLVMAPLVGLLIGLIPALLNKEALAQITTLATGGATLIGVLTAWLRSQTTWLKERIDKADAVQRQYDTCVTKELAKYTEQMREQEDELSRLRSYLAATERKREEAERRVAEAQDRLEKATTTTLLSDFIQDRAASQDYRRHLGVLALIRDDFEKLSSLMEEENRRLYTDEIATLEDEKKGETERINRIVLYIDDLDRCPPNVVTDVLQAVHLLLAFPLFVVVVAVDARWIKRSLRARYEELLHTSGRDTDQDEHEEIFGRATPEDYLEKIFQIPFWLNPVGQDASRRMVEGLLEDSLTDSEPAEVTNATVGEQEIRAPETGPGAEPSDASHTEVPGEQTLTQPSEEQGGRVPTEPQSNATPEGRGRPDAPDEDGTPGPFINPTSLDITPSEMEFIIELAPLLGRSPRALKRFVNVYRLIKAGLSEQEDRRFLVKGLSLSDYQVVLFLLAIDTGLPHIAQDFFDALRSAPDRNASLRTLIDSFLGEPVSMDSTKERFRLKQWLLPEDAAHEEARKLRLPDDVNALAAWERRVLRYSFRADQA
jgi:hypothetical protein